MERRVKMKEKMKRRRSGEGRRDEKLYLDRYCLDGHL